MLYVQSLSSTRATDKTTEVLEEVEFPFVICFQFLIFNISLENNFQYLYTLM